MTVSHRKNKPKPSGDSGSGAAAGGSKGDENVASTSSAADPGVRYHCDSCNADITLTVRISCADPICGSGFDLCGSCFCEGAEVGNHKPWHAYRVVEQHSYPIFCDDWGADEELLLIDGAQIYGLGNWADIADHIGNRTKEEVEAHYLAVYIEGRDGTAAGDERAERAIREAEEEARRMGEPRPKLPVVGPNMNFRSTLDADTFQKRKRRRIDNLRSGQAAFSGATASTSKPAAPPKPLVSAPTSHSELAGFMPGRLEFEQEYEHEAENLIKDMEFGKVYRFGGEAILDEMAALGGKVQKGRSRMEASSRGGKGVAVGSRGKATQAQAKKGEAAEEREQDGAEGGPDKDQDDEAEEGAEERDADPDKGKEKDREEEDVEHADESVAAAEEGETQPATAEAGAPGAAAPPPAPAEADDKAPDWDEDEADLELKLMVLEMYNDRLDRRLRRREFIFERNLVDYRRNVAAERRRLKEERELLSRVRHFAQMQTSTDFEDFFNGLCYEEALRRSVIQLQNYRRLGITTLAEAATYDAAAAERAKKAAIVAEGGLLGLASTSSGPRSAGIGSSGRGRGARDSSLALGVTAEEERASVPAMNGSQAAAAASTSATVAPPSATGGSASKKDASAESKAKRKPPKPLDLSQHPSLHLLTRNEQELCSVQRMQPNAFLVLKKEIITEFMRRRGKLSRREARGLVKMDVNRLGKIYDFLAEEGYLRAAVDVGWDGGPGGVGTPPGWRERKPTAAATPQQDGQGVVGTPRGPNGGRAGGNGIAAPSPKPVKLGGSGGGGSSGGGSVKPARRSPAKANGVTGGGGVWAGDGVGNQGVHRGPRSESLAAAAKSSAGAATSRRTSPIKPPSQQQQQQPPPRAPAVS